MILYHNETRFPKPHSGDALREFNMSRTNETEDTAPAPGAEAGAGAGVLTAQQAQQVQQPKKSGRIIGAAKWVLAIDAWKKHATILKKRASFPLLRHVLKNSATANRILIPTSVIADEYIAKSIVGHRWIMWTMAIVCCYYITIFAKGLAIAVKYGDVWNTWLISSVAMILFTSFRGLLSRKVLKAFTVERDLRSRQTDNVAEGNAVNEAA